MSKSSSNPHCYCKKEPRATIVHHIDQNDETRIVCSQTPPCKYNVSYQDYEKSKEWFSISEKERTRIKLARKNYKARREDQSTHTAQSACTNFFNVGKCPFGVDCKFLAPIKTPKKSYHKKREDQSTHTLESACTNFIDSGYCQFGIWCKFTAPPKTQKTTEEVHNMTC